ncbi:MAG: iron-siderophore ABC transporter substrate-binding protein, partial [Micrococcales bacterium]|nr:iron-siderophore ABC transporter substrate-binding protein [Micrococcales bacterium]
MTSRHHRPARRAALALAVTTSLALTACGGADEAATPPGGG